MKKQNTIVLVTAIICLAGLEIFAMHKGIDGYLFSLVAITIAGIAGTKVPAVWERFKKRGKK